MSMVFKAVAWSTYKTKIKDYRNAQGVEGHKYMYYKLINFPRNKLIEGKLCIYPCFIPQL